MQSTKILRHLLIWVAATVTLNQTAHAAYTVSGTASLSAGIVAGSDAVEITLRGLFF